MSSEDARHLAATSPASFAHVTSAGLWVPYEHLLRLNEHLMALVAGEIDRLIVTMPPQHGKSELISRYFPAWYLGTFPDRKVLLGSYQARYANSWGRKARELLEEFGPWIWGVDVAEEPRAADWWFTDQGGYMASDGAGGAFTGKGAHLMVIDDPVKGHEDAQSEVMRDKVWDWWVATLSSRLQQENAVVLVQTRWHEDDLAGRLLLHEPAEWTVLNLPAIAEQGDALGRQEGEPLCPELHTLEKLQRQRMKGEYWFAALYQQRPAPPEGLMFKRKDFGRWRMETRDLHGILERTYVVTHGDDSRRFDAAPCPIFQTTDAAISEKETADFTVVATWTITGADDLILLDIQRRHFEEQMVVQFLAAENDKWGRPPMWIERFGAGRNPLARLKRMGYPVMEIPAEAGTQSDKVTRAFGAVALCEQHKLFFPFTAEWLGDYEHELASFPNATNDDQVDVTSYAARLVSVVKPGRGRAQRENVGPRPHSAGVRNEQF